MFQTRYELMEPSAQQRGQPQPPLELECDPAAERIDLPGPAKLLKAWPIDLTDAIRRRVSVRQYAGQPLTLEELSYLLWCTQGVKKVLHGAATLRTVPSAGARHALETYLLANAVEDLPAGLYRFCATQQKLLKLRQGPGIADDLAAACLGQDFVGAAAVAFCWAAVAYRMTWRYGQRGYRYLLLDAGHVCQNLYLAAEAIDCGVCAIGAFDDEQVNHVLGIDGTEQFAVYLAAVGKKQSRR
jgi:SagB-type dehydrogenase family enzyme